MKLDNLKMPERKKKLSEMDMKDMSPAEGSPEEEASESPEEEAKEGDMGEPANPADLEMISDDDLLAEIKKRGLMAKLEGQPHDEGPEANAPADLSYS